MYQHILMAGDGSAAQKGVEMGLSLAKVPRARVTAITASAPWSIASDGRVAVAFDAYAQAATLEAAKTLASVGKPANQLEVECAMAHVKEHPADGILQAARSKGMRFDLLWPQTAAAALRARQSGGARSEAQCGAMLGCK